MINIVLKSKLIIKNFDYLSSKGNIIWPCLKKDAYGLGINNVLKILSNNVNTICTDSIVDIIKVRKNFLGDILYFGDINKKIITKVKKLNFIPTIYSLNQIEYLDKNIKKVFIELNSGLNRYGCNADEIEILINKIIEKGIEVNGIMVHFHEQDNNSITKNLDIFNFILKLKDKYLIKYLSCLSTETACIYETFPENIIRPGIGLYGYFSHKDTISYKLKNTIFVSTYISNIRNIKKGESFGYGKLNICKKDTKIAIIPIGYADGVMKISEQVGCVFIGNKKCTIISVSMSCSFIDISNASPNLSDSVEIIGNNINLYDWGTWCKTIPQEILLGFCKGRDIDLKII